MTVNVVLDVLIVLSISVILGKLFQKIGIVKVAGELLSSMIVGPSLLGIVSYRQELSGITAVAIFQYFFS